MLNLMEIGYLSFEGNRLGYVYFLLFSAILVFKVHSTQATGNEIHFGVQNCSIHATHSLQRIEMYFPVRHTFRCRCGLVQMQAGRRETRRLN